MVINGCGFESSRLSEEVFWGWSTLVFGGRSSAGGTNAAAISSMVRATWSEASDL